MGMNLLESLLKTKEEETVVETEIVGDELVEDVLVSDEDLDDMLNEEDVHDMLDGEEEELNDEEIIDDKPNQVGNIVGAKLEVDEIKINEDVKINTSVFGDVTERLVITIMEDNNYNYIGLNVFGAAGSAVNSKYCVIEDMCGFKFLGKEKQFKDQIRLLTLINTAREKALAESSSDFYIMKLTQEFSASGIVYSSLVATMSDLTLYADAFDCSIEIYGGDSPSTLVAKIINGSNG